MHSVLEYYSNNILFIFVFGHNSESEYYSYSYSAKYMCTYIIRICICSFWKNEYYLYLYLVKILITNIIRIRIRIRSKEQYSLNSGPLICIHAYVPYCLIIHQFTLGLVSKHISYCPPHLADHSKPIGSCHFVVLYANWLFFQTNYVLAVITLPVCLVLSLSLIFVFTKCIPRFVFTNCVLVLWWKMAWMFS